MSLHDDENKLEMKGGQFSLNSWVAEVSVCWFSGHKMCTGMQEIVCFYSGTNIKNWFLLFIFRQTCIAHHWSITHQKAVMLFLIFLLCLFMDIKIFFPESKCTIMSEKEKAWTRFECLNFRVSAVPCKKNTNIHGLSVYTVEPYSDGVKCTWGDYLYTGVVLFVFQI